MYASITPHLTPVASPDYRGEAGVVAMQTLQQALINAQAIGDWQAVRKLDLLCMQVADKVIEANRGDQSRVLHALEELKDVYANLIARCQQEVCLLASR